MTVAYPTTGAERDRWILERRGPRNKVSAHTPYAFLVEEERLASGEVGPVATIFLTNRECPWRCAMCDLWRNTLSDSVPPGAIPRQIEYALDRLPPARQIKLYNSGSFFDPRAIPPEDYAAIASLVRRYERVIVECHPALVGERCTQFRDLLGIELEIAMGLETVHPLALEQLNKRMTPLQFATAAEWLSANAIALRTFLLVQPPFISVAQAPLWLSRSVEFALHCSSVAVALIATRAGNGAVESIEATGHFIAPDLTALEDALDQSLVQARSKGGRARIFADLWDVDRLATCDACRTERIDRLRAMNDSQLIELRIRCSLCDGQA